MTTSSTYELKFGKHALRTWRKLDASTRRQFQKKLEKVLHNPHVPSMRLRKFDNSYRIKLRKSGYRLGYRVFDKVLFVVVIAVGHRDKDEIYEDFALHYHAGEP